MPKRARERAATVGVADHWGWAILVTVHAEGTLVDRRRVELVEPGLPAYPHHHEAQSLPVERAVALVQRVTRSVEARARVCLDTLAGHLALPIAGIALRVCPRLPATVAECISNYQAHNVADSVMYRSAIARAAEAKGWFVHWYSARRVHADAAKSLGLANIDALLDHTGTALGPPWQKDHRLAMAAAIAAAAAREA